MKDYLVYLPLTILYLVLKSTILPGAGLPDITLIIIFYMASKKASVDGAVFAFILGFIDDAFSGSVMGSASFCLVAVYIGTHLASRKVQFSTPSLKICGAFTASLVKSIIIYMIVRAANPGAWFLGKLIIQAALTGATAPFVITMLQKFTGYLSPHSFKDNEN